MKIISILATVVLFLSASISLPAKPYIPSRYLLPSPEIKYVSIKDADHVTVGWDPVTVSEDNPILGFKFKVWELTCRNKTISNEENGKIVYSTANTLARKSKELIFEATMRPDVFQITFGGIQESSIYYLRVQTYSSDGDGPLADFKTVRFVKLRSK